MDRRNSNTSLPQAIQSTPSSFSTNITSDSIFSSHGESGNASVSSPPLRSPSLASKYEPSIVFLGDDSDPVDLGWASRRSFVNPTTQQKKDMSISRIEACWGPNFEEFLEHPYWPRTVPNPDGSRRRAIIGDRDTVPLDPSEWSEDLLRKLRIMAVTHNIDAVTAGRNIVVQIERRLKKSGTRKTMGMTKSDVQKAMESIQEMKAEQHGSEEDDEIWRGKRSASTIHTTVDALNPEDGAGPSGFKPEVDSPTLSPAPSLVSQLHSAATGTNTNRSTSQARATRDLKRKLEEIGFDQRQLELDQRQLVLDRRMARAKAQLQHARELGR